MNVRRPTVCVALAWLFCAPSMATEMPDVGAIVPRNFVLQEVIRGDLNKDQQEDVVLLVKATDPTKVVENRFGKVVDRNRRGLVVAFRTRQGHDVALKNLDCFSSENEDGGVYFAPELTIEAVNGRLQISFLHGRYGYWSYVFRHREADFDLIGYDSSDNQGPVVQSTLSINLLTRQVQRKVNTNREAEGGDERFKLTWSRVNASKPIKLSSIADFDQFSVTEALGIPH